jgi:hypothetical protein
MTSEHSLLLDFSFPLFRDTKPLTVIGPTSGSPASIRQFTELSDWRQHVQGLSLRGNVPVEFRQKYDRALRLLFMAWLDETVIKIAELAALATLEGAIKMKFQKEQFKGKGLAAALKHLLENTDISDADLPIWKETGGAVIDNIWVDGKDKSKKSRLYLTLNKIRNRTAHGDPFEEIPWGGIFEVVRDLIDYMYPAE